MIHFNTPMFKWLAQMILLLWNDRKCAIDYH
jgi:hypothetical protein